MLYRETILFLLIKINQSEICGYMASQVDNKHCFRYIDHFSISYSSAKRHQILNFNLNYVSKYKYIGEEHIEL